MGPTLELKLTDSAPDTWHTVSHSKCVKCFALHSLPRKTCKFLMSRNSTKFDVVARFHETIPMVNPFHHPRSRKILDFDRNYNFVIFQKIRFSRGFTVVLSYVFLLRLYMFLVLFSHL